MSSIVGRRAGSFPSPPGKPVATNVSGETVDLEWAPPAASGGSGIQGYRVEIRHGGEGDFSVHLANSRDPEPHVIIVGLTPMSWLEFRVSAINSTGFGPAGVTSDPVLTRAPTGSILGGKVLGGAGSGEPSLRYSYSVSRHDGREALGVGRSGRRRRTNQDPDALLRAEREACTKAAAHEQALARDVERSLASMAAWVEVFKVRHGRSPRDEDRDESRWAALGCANHVHGHAHECAHAARVRTPGRATRARRAQARLYGAAAPWR